MIAYVIIALVAFAAGVIAGPRLRAKASADAVAAKAVADHALQKLDIAIADYQHDAAATYAGIVVHLHELASKL
jgi:hypothetical protein